MWDREQRDGRPFRCHPERSKRQRAEPRDLRQGREAGGRDHPIQRRSLDSASGSARDDSGGEGKGAPRAPGAVLKAGVGLYGGAAAPYLWGWPPLPLWGRTASRGALSGALAAAALGLSAAPAAQSPLRTLDPFYQGESARRDFYGGLAVSGEVAYRTADLLRPSAGPTAASDVALSVQLDYSLLPQVDVSAVVDLSGGIGRGPTGLSWIVVKPYWFNEDTDYAVRIAVDPASEGGSASARPTSPSSRRPRTGRR